MNNIIATSMGLTITGFTNSQYHDACPQMPFQAEFSSATDESTNPHSPQKRYNIAATRQVVIKELWQGVENLVCTRAAKQQNTQQNTLPLTRKSFTRTATFSLANDGAADVIFAAVKHSVINWPHLEFHHLSCERNKNA